MSFKSLFSQKLKRYYLEPRIFVVNIQIQLKEKIILMDETVIAHSKRKALAKAEDSVKGKIIIQAVGSKSLGKSTQFKNI
ncbi:MAG: hypothetical protein R6V49_03235 [Bacteroidales bacterium]|jgi:hypothetical protein